MQIDLSTLTPSQVYFTMTQTLVPRPIAWVLSENEDGGYNLAPFSYFTAVCSDPPLLLFSAGRRPEGGPKDSTANIEARRRFVVHIAPRELVEPLNASAASLAPGVSEVEQLGLATVPFQGFPLPRLEGCRVAFACELDRVIELGRGPQALILGEVKAIYLDDEAVSRDHKGRLKVHADRLDPVSRLGPEEYAALGEITRLVRPA